MAIVHKATVTPSKQAIVTDWLDRQPWGGSGAVKVLGSYRFDDPDGEVGVEALLVDRGGTVLHVPLTYRGAHLAESKKFLVGTMQHSVLGDRWIYDAAGDPVGVDCFVRALRAAMRDVGGLEFRIRCAWGLLQVGDWPSMKANPCRALPRHYSPCAKR